MKTNSGLAIDRTTDAGAKWQPIGSLGLRADIARIRFADSTHGFALSGDTSLGRSLVTSVDGGKTWKQLGTPFSNVFDFAISRGVIHAVAETSGAQFRIWSSPADHLSWTESPLVMGSGAGPVISFQFVLSGDAGWLIEDDRGPVGGAQLAANGEWVAWNPPCADVGAGSISLAASSGNDLVGVCDEGVWTGPKVEAAVYFSHDAGLTFQRHVAPISGDVASTNARRAVVVSGSTVWRTTDDGATWRVVFTGGDRFGISGSDLGFTITTQGFVILGSGQMLMTHDAGASWQSVTLP